MDQGKSTAPGCDMSMQSLSRKCFGYLYTSPLQVEEVSEALDLKFDYFRFELTLHFKVCFLRIQELLISVDIFERRLSEEVVVSIAV